MQDRPALHCRSNSGSGSRGRSRRSKDPSSPLRSTIRSTKTEWSAKSSAVQGTLSLMRSGKNLQKKSSQPAPTQILSSKSAGPASQGRYLAALTKPQCSTAATTHSLNRLSVFHLLLAHFGAAKYPEYPSTLLPISPAKCKTANSRPAVSSKSDRRPFRLGQFHSFDTHTQPGWRSVACLLSLLLMRMLFAVTPSPHL